MKKREKISNEFIESTKFPKVEEKIEDSSKEVNIPSIVKKPQSEQTSDLPKIIVDEAKQI